jgi:hypothetical protein
MEMEVLFRAVRCDYLTAAACDLGGQLVHRPFPSLGRRPHQAKSIALSSEQWEKMEISSPLSSRGLPGPSENGASIQVPNKRLLSDYHPSDSSRSCLSSAPALNQRERRVGIRDWTTGHTVDILVTELDPFVRAISRPISRRRMQQP